MTVGVIDLSYTKMHFYINSEYLKAISNFSKIIIIDDQQNYLNISSEKIELVNGKLINLNSKSALISRFYWIINFFKSNSKLKNVDKVFYFGYDIIVLAFGQMFLKNNKKIYLIHHKHIDELKNPIKRFIFSTFLKKMNHIVMGDFIANFLQKEINIDKKNIFIVRHPAYNFDVKNDQIKSFFIALSYSNDEKLINELILIEKNLKLFEKNKITFLVKSKIQAYKSEYLKVFTGELSRKEYNNAFNNCSGVVILNNKNFKYRVSGTMIDALSYNKIVFASKTPSFTFFKESNKNLIKFFSDPIDLINKLSESKLNYFDLDDDFKKFRFKNSSLNLKKDFKKIFLNDNK